MSSGNTPPLPARRIADALHRRPEHMLAIGSRAARQSLAPRAFCSSASKAAAPAPAPAPAAAPAPAPAPAAAPAPAPAASSEEGPRLHSTDIAFKPTTDGWGYSHVYGSGWDNIFKKKGKAEPLPLATPAPDPQQQLAAKLEALETALGMGALSPALYEQARRELA